eukprot:gene24038-42688_t
MAPPALPLRCCTRDAPMGTPPPAALMADCATPGPARRRARARARWRPLSDGGQGWEGGGGGQNDPAMFDRFSACATLGTDGAAAAGRCAVCQDDFAAGDGVRRLNCFHVFHARCVDPWLCRSLTCPMCKPHVPHVQGRPRLCRSLTCPMCKVDLGDEQRRQDDAAGKLPSGALPV